MKIYQEIELRDFEAWSGAKYTMEKLEELYCNSDIDVWNILEDYLDSEEEPMDETELNDFLWFEDDFIASLLDFEDWEALERFVDGEEDEEEEEEDEDEEEE